VKPLILVIGGTNSGKSTIISSLTGCLYHTFRGEVKDNATGKIIYIIGSSPQEESLELREFSRILNNVHNKPSTIGLVIAVQPTYPRTRLSLEDIVQKAQENNRFIIYSFLLDPPYDGEGIDVEQTRNRLTALGLVVRYLDARRFAFLNALDIRQVTGIP
jgi:energy-coupling factor transporter ATP-binding protein EcfA2